MNINILTSLGAYNYLQEKELDYIQFYYNTDEGIEKGNIYIADNSFYVCIGNLKSDEANIRNISIDKKDLNISVNSYKALSPIAPLNNLESLNISELDLTIKEAE